MRHVLLLLALIAMPSIADARCRQLGVTAELLSPNRQLASDAALVVRLVPGPDRTSTTFPALSLTQGSDTIPLRLEALTSSLARYVPERPPGPGRWSILGRTVTFGSHTAAALAAPRLTSARSVANQRGRRGSQYTVSAVLETVAPMEAIAVFAQHGNTTFGDGHHIAGRNEIVVFDWRTRCLQWPDGMTPPPTSGALRLRFVGEDGQLSAPSNPVSL